MLNDEIIEKFRWEEIGFIVTRDNVESLLNELYKLGFTWCGFNKEFNPFDRENSEEIAILGNGNKVTYTTDTNDIPGYDSIYPYESYPGTTMIRYEEV